MTDKVTEREKLMKRHFPKSPTIDELWDAVERSLDDAGKALPVLMTMLKHASGPQGRPIPLPQGIAVADEMMGAVEYAKKALPVLRAEAASASAGQGAPSKGGEA